MVMTLRCWHHQGQVWSLCDFFKNTCYFVQRFKKKYMIFKRHVIVNVAPLYFKGSPINCVHECDLLVITLASNRTTGNVIEKAIMKFNINSNEVF